MSKTTARPESLSSRRLLVAGLLAVALVPASAREGVEVGSTSRWAKLVPADQLEASASQQYQQLLGEAQRQNALLPADHPQSRRLREIAKRIIPQAMPWNSRAKDWKWAVQIVVSPQLNAFCMPGGKIAFYYGILEKLKLSDDEVAMIMGHEVAHALREHARERIGKSMSTNVAVSGISALLGLGDLGRTVAGGIGELTKLGFSREDESEADLVGLELAARAGYDPSAGVSLWEKMNQAAKGAPPKWFSTHPPSKERIRDIQANIPKVQGLYERSAKPPQRFEVAAPLK
ncbi:M48 family metallopeptidase [Pelomonas sp. SE-A7]|uniref:M48 family metallopeptidase n=1 Tax=Pelomonas sp. SE-A7 TaxID=3054953 RepID=UPI00259C9C83|nr:M48 family metallopeptidase [Pelomonas sp. SE-A7]MDM4767099.1 M48 family metallopeptidase [Pelomonas sp. SE-A7]